MQDCPDFAGTRAALARYDNLTETRALLDRMADRATADPDYRAALHDWLVNGATLKLRDLARPLGDYWGNRHNFNLLCALDSAHLHRRDPLPANA